MKQNVEVLIAGGGIGGLATAISCANAGHNVTVLERASEFAEVGAGLQLGPNGANALDGLGVLDHLKEKAVFPSRISVYDVYNNESLTYLDLSTPFVERFGRKYMVMHRSDLLDALLVVAREKAAITLVNNKQVTSATFGDDISTVACADGSSYSCKMLIGADGYKSTLRPLIAGEDKIRCEGYVAYRGTIPFSNVKDHAGDDNVVLFTGDRVHLVQYPVRGGELFNQVAVFKSDKYSPDHDQWALPDELEAAFLPTSDYVRNSVAQVNKSFRWPLQDRDPIKNWTKGNAALIGDAAHPMYQYLAQGACQALEDAVTIGQCLTGSSGNVLQALAEYQKIRVYRTGRVQLTARAFGTLIHYGGIEAQIRNFAMRMRNPSDYAPVEWIYSQQFPPS